MNTAAGKDGPPDAGGRAEPARVAALDGVRGIAILLVLAFHLTVYSVAGVETSVLDEFVLKVTSAGWIGVDLFFVLSGYLITSILLNASAAGLRPYFGNFYARRALRIWPVYIAFLVFLLVVLSALFSSATGAVGVLRDQQLWLWTYLYNIRLYTEPALALSAPYAGHLWSLAIEEQFYLVWPAVVLLLRGRGLLCVATLAFVGAAATRIVLYHGGQAPGAIYYLTPAHMDGLAAGAAIAVVAASAAGRRWLRAAAWPAFGAGLLGFALVFAIRRTFLPYDAWVLRAGITSVVLLFGGLVAAAALAPRAAALSRGLGNRLLATLGKYSYAMYVVHWPVAILLATHTDIPESMPTVLGSALPGMAVFIACAGAITFAVSVASWYLLESPVLRLRRLFPQPGLVMYAASAGTEGRSGAEAKSAPVAAPATSATRAQQALSPQRPE